MILKPTSLEQGSLMIRNSIEFCETNNVSSNDVHREFLSGIKVLSNANWFESAIGPLYGRNTMVQIGFKHIVPNIVEYVTDPELCQSSMHIKNKYEVAYLALLQSLKEACEKCEQRSNEPDMIQLCKYMKMVYEDTRIKQSFKLLYVSSRTFRILFDQLFPKLTQGIANDTTIRPSTSVPDVLTNLLSL